MKPPQRQQIYSAVANQYVKWYGANHMKGGSCLYWTLTGLGILTSLGFDAILQAGSMSWPILPIHLDDGIKPTHFTYEWSPQRSESQKAIKSGLLPEIHLWIALPEQKELVDFSTIWLPQQATKAGLEWRTELPPDFLWCAPSDLPERVVYRPDVEAIKFALRFIHTQPTNQTPT